MRLMAFALTLSGGVLAGGLSPAHAAPLSATELLQQYNLITTGDVTGTSGFHVDGRVLAGGDWKVDAWSVVHMNGKGAASDFDEFVVAGTVANPVHLNNGGSAAVGGGKANVNLNGGGTATDYTAASAPQGYGQVLSDYATGLSGLAASEGVTRNENKFDVSGVAGSTAVINLKEADITAQRDFNFIFGAADWIVLNILATDTDKAFQMNNVKVQPGHATASKVIWNFIGFETVTFDGLFQGTILADGAKVTTLAGNIEGSVFASAFEGKSELHYMGVGELPHDNGPAPIPLPTSAPLLLAGIGALAALRRRKAA